MTSPHQQQARPYVIILSHYPARAAIRRDVKTLNTPHDYPRLPRSKVYIPYIYGRVPKSDSQRFFETAIHSDVDGCLLWHFTADEDGYGKMRYGGRTLVVTRLICEVVHGQPPERRYQAAHSCGVPACVNPKHLSWKTPRDNAADKAIHGTNQVGEKTSAAKMTEVQVLEIRRLVEFKSQRQVAKEYGISLGTLWKIVKRKSWRHI